MKGITKKSVAEDIKLISEMCDKYLNAIWENQEGQKAHFDNQEKIVKVCMSDIRFSLKTALTSLQQLKNVGFEEDEEQ